MKFEIEKIKNFAVIKENIDKIVLNDLTIFMGDNSAGKSYLAILFNLLINLEEELSSFLDISSIKDKEVYHKFIKIVNKIDNEGEIKISFKKDEILELRDVLEKVVEGFIRKHFKKMVSTSFDLKLNYSEFEEIKCLIKKSQSDSLFEFIIKFEEKIVGIESKVVIEKEDFKLDSFIKKIFETFFVFLVKASFNIPTSIYLPAARTGYLHTYPILGEYAIKRTFSFKGKGNDIELPEWIKRFILNLFIPVDNIVEDEISKIIEKEILLGEVKVYKKESKIEFFKGRKKIDMAYTSSSISELIPLVVFLKKGIIKKGSLLIIEEPESHLSFENQRKIARIIAKLVNQGIKVLITTHSDFFVQEINNLIIAHSIPEEKRIDEYKNITLDYKKVNVYNFLFKTKSKSIITKVDVKKDGIDNEYVSENILKRVNDMQKLYSLMGDE